MELSIIRWSIAGCTCNFKMNITLFISVVFSAASLYLTVRCVGDNALQKKKGKQIPFPLCISSTVFPFVYGVTTQEKVY